MSGANKIARSALCLLLALGVVLGGAWAGRSGRVDAASRRSGTIGAPRREARRAAVRGAPGSPRIAGRVRWTEGDDRCSLTYSVQSRKEGARCSLNLRFRRDSGSGTWTSERTDAHTNDLWAEIKLAVPIRVRGSRAPQLLVKLYRPNWLDYEIYTAYNDGVEKRLHFSCRDENAIEWVASKGQLTGFITFDRYGAPPASLSEGLPSGTRLQLREEWRYDGYWDRWMVVKKKWEKYEVGDHFGNRGISKPSDCTFRYDQRR